MFYTTKTVSNVNRCSSRRNRTNHQSNSRPVSGSSTCSSSSSSDSTISSINSSSSSCANSSNNNNNRHNHHHHHHNHRRRHRNHHHHHHHHRVNGTSVGVSADNPYLASVESLADTCASSQGMYTSFFFVFLIMIRISIDYYYTFV